MNDAVSLHELNQSIKLSLYDAFPETIWVIAEINELKVNRSGHCYLSLIEKDEDSDDILAQSRAIIWSSTFRLLKPYFENSTGQPLAAGIKILARVEVEFHELYGLSLNIKDIEPAFTMGELEKQKLEILNRLTEEGIIELNKELPLTLCPQKIAVISSETAAGWGDFQNQLSNNPYQYYFQVTLFPAVMQGKEAGQSILNALDSIYEKENEYDVVVLIRGGGAQIDLHCFNTYNLAAHITQFPLPVLTGIGHEKDETIADIVAHTRLKTPTAVAAFLIDRLASFEQELTELSGDVAHFINDKTEEEHQKLIRTATAWLRQTQTISHFQQLKLNNYLSKAHQLLTKTLDKYSAHLESLASEGRHRSSVRITRDNNLLNTIQTRTRFITKQFLTANANNLSLLSNRLEKHDPVSAFSRGFTITYQHGKRISSIKMVDQNTPVETLFRDGVLKSVPSEKREHDNNEIS